MDTTDEQAKVFEAACERNRARIDAMRTDSPEHSAYIEGLADGIEFATTKT